MVVKQGVIDFNEDDNKGRLIKKHLGRSEIDETIITIRYMNEYLGFSIEEIADIYSAKVVAIKAIVLYETLQGLVPSLIYDV